MKSRPKALLLAASILWVAVTPIAARWLVVEKKLDRADALVVMAGSSAYVERTHHAAAIYRKGIVGLVVVTNGGGAAGWSQTEQRTPPYLELAVRELERSGVSSDAIMVLQDIVSGTGEEVELVRATAERESWRRIIVVTSAYHTRRALRTFERLFARQQLKTEIGVESPPPGIQTPGPNFWWCSPAGWRDVAAEYVKTAYYIYKY